MDAPPPFLALPVELRLQIYRYVIHSNVDPREHVHTERNKISQLVPWLSIKCTNKTVAAEFKSLISSAEHQKQDANHAWVVDAAMEPKSKGWFSIVWTNQRIPCSPLDADIAVLNLRIPDDNLLVNQSGSIMQMAMSYMYEPLTTKGTCVVRSSRLRDPVRFRQVIVNFWGFATTESEPCMVSFFTYVQHHWFKRGYSPEDLHFNLLDEKEGSIVTTGKLRFNGRRLVETSDMRLRPFIRPQIN